MEMVGFSDLQTYWSCPRLYAFTRLLGYSPPVQSEPMTTGSFVHVGLSAYFRGQDPAVAVAEALMECCIRLGNIQDIGETVKATKMLITALKRAAGLISRYLAHWASDYKATLVEPELQLDNVVCHPDLIAFYQEQRVIVDFKTSYSPDLRWYDMSGQCDLYAYVLQELGEGVSLIIYDAISEEGIYRHIRPPRLEIGKSIFDRIISLGQLTLESCLADPHPGYQCPNKCSFFLPCWLLETSDWDTCKDYLTKYYIGETIDEAIEH